MDFRPVKLKEYVKTGDALLAITDTDQRRPDNLMMASRSLPVLSSDVRKIDPDGLGTLVAEIVPLLSCLVFCSTKKNCESVAQLICRSLPPSLLKWRTNQKRNLSLALHVYTFRSIFSFIFSLI